MLPQWCLLRYVQSHAFVLSIIDSALWFFWWAWIILRAWSEASWSTMHLLKRAPQLQLHIIEIYVQSCAWYWISLTRNLTRSNQKPGYYVSLILDYDYEDDSGLYSELCASQIESVETCAILCKSTRHHWLTPHSDCVDAAVFNLPWIETSSQTKQLLRCAPQLHLFRYVQ